MLKAEMIMILWKSSLLNSGSIFKLITWKWKAKAPFLYKNLHVLQNICFVYLFLRKHRNNMFQRNDCVNIVTTNYSFYKNKNMKWFFTTLLLFVWEVFSVPREINKRKKKHGMFLLFFNSLLVVDKLSNHKHINT